jgi:hypothetical protein
MHRVIGLLVIACGGTAPPPPLGNTQATPVVAPPADAAVEDCESRVESWEPGHHDRYAFEDPATNKFGFKDGRGQIVIPARFHHVYEFGPGGVAAAVDGTSPFVFLAPDGRVIARAYPYDNGPDYFQEGHARIIDARRKVGFLSETGVIVIPPRFDEAESFCHGRADVREGVEWFVIDPRGRRIP